MSSTIGTQQPIGQNHLDHTSALPNFSTSDMALLVGLASMQSQENKINTYYSQLDNVSRTLKNINQALAASGQQQLKGGSLRDVKLEFLGPDGKVQEMNMEEFLKQLGVDHPKGHLAGFLEKILGGGIMALLNKVGLEKMVPQELMDQIVRAVGSLITTLLEDAGIKLPNSFHSLDVSEWKTIVDGLKLKSEDCGSDNQKGMMKLQAILNQYNETTQTVSSTLNKSTQINSAVISNMR